MVVGDWPRALLPYLENNPGMLICPEGGFHGLLADAPPLSELIRVYLSVGGWNYYYVLNGPFVAKMSDTQYKAARAAKYLAHGKNLYDIYSGYVEDGNPKVVWYCIEESVAGRESFQADEKKGTTDPTLDFEDLDIRVTDEGDGTFNLYFWVGSLHVYVAKVFRADTGETLYDVPPSPPYRLNYGPVGSFAGGGSESSYGMNEWATNLKGGGGKVLALDYSRIVAKTTKTTDPPDRWADKKFDADADLTPDFARHFGRANILFSDGSVQALAPYKIDPISPSTARTWWEP